MKGIDYVEVISANKLSVDMSANAELSLLKVTKAVGDAAIKAAGTTDISAYLDGTTSEAITTKGGNSVYVELTKAAATTDTVTVGTVAAGAVSDAAKGDVKVSVTGKAYDADNNVTLGTIAVNGGKTITVTQQASSDKAAAAADLSAQTITQGAINIATDASTTTITVKQDAAVAGKNAAYTTGGVTETASVKFGALKNGDVLVSNGLTFTAKADMTAEQVASAFAKLINGSLPVSGDTQASATFANGIYTGVFATSAGAPNTWTSAAANGDTVVFTASRANVNATDLTFTLTNTSTKSVAPVVTTTQGKAADATAAGGVATVVAGAVTVAGNSAGAVKTVTVDGYSVTGSGITADTTVLETLNLSNGGAFAVAGAAETLNLNLKNVGTAAVAATLTTDAVIAASATLDLNNTATKTLNVKSDGVNTAALDLQHATGTTALNVSGTGLLNSSDAAANLGNVATIKVTETAGLNLGTAVRANVTSVDTSGTTGAVTINIDGGKATYTGGAGVDNVTIGQVTGTFNKAIKLGAGNDTLNLSALTDAQLKAIPAGTSEQLDGGEGTDTIVLSAAAAVELSKDGAFAGKIRAFDKLSLTNATATGTVDMSNLDNIDYVISANSASIAAAATKEVFTIDFATSGTVTGADNIVFDGLTVTLAGGETPAQIAAAFAAKSSTNWDVSSVAGSVVTFTAKTAGVTPDVTAANITINDVDATTAARTVTTTVQGDATTAEVFTVDFTASGAIEDADTIVFDGGTATLATGDSAATIATKVAAATYANWTTTRVGNVVTFTNKALGAVADVTAANFVVTNVSSVTTAPVIAAPTVTTQGAAAGVAAPALTINKLANNGTLELTAAGAGAIVNITDAATGTADVLNVVLNAATGSNLGTVKAADVETLNLSVTNKTTTFSTVYGTVKVADAASVNTLALDANAAKAVTVTGAGALELSIAAATKVATVDASTATGALTLDLSTQNGVAVTVKGGAGNDVLKATVGANAKADVLSGGAGADTLVAGTNAAKLTGGEGNDLFVLQFGNKESNTYSSITDFQAGDLLQLKATIGGAAITTFGKLTATLNETTSVFANFVDAAIAQAGAGEAVVFNFKGNAYVVIDQGADSATTFANGTDSVIELVGVDAANVSFNATYGTIALI
jgi:hypothetical protein